MADFRASDLCSCEACDIARIFTRVKDPARKTRVYRGERASWQNVQSFIDAAQDCMFCAYLLAILESVFSGPFEQAKLGGGKVMLSIRDIAMRQSPQDFSQIVYSVADLDLIVQRYSDGDVLETRYTRNLAPYQVDLGEGLVHGRIVPPSLNVSLVGNWMRACVSNHAETCKNAQPDQDFPFEANARGWSMRVIDVHRRCVVQRPANATYTALSYVWGPNTQLSLTRSTRHRLFGEGGLSNGHKDLPATIDDAIVLTSQLGYKYLWVDALCIMQDDEGDKLTQIHNMGRIYSGASLTIVSAGSSVYEHIPRLHANEAPLVQHIFRLGKAGMIECADSFREAVGSSLWMTRAWSESANALTPTQDQD